MSLLADGKVIIDTEIDQSGIDKGTSALTTKMQGIGGKMQTVGGAMAKAFGIAGTGIAAGLGVAVKSSMDFGAQMSRVGAISGANGKQFDALKKAALDLGASTSLSAGQVAQGMESMAALGFTTNDILKAMPGVISAAEASGTDLATTANIVSAAINGFGLSAKDSNHVADVMTETANRSAASVEDLGYAFKYAAPVAKGLGVSMEDLAAATGIMTNAGLSGEQAGTTLRASLLALANPSKTASAELKALGINTKDSKGNFVGFPSIIAQFQKSMAGMTGTQKTAALAQVFGTESASGMLTVIDKGPASFNKFSTALKNSDGASAEAAKKMKDNLQGAVQELGGAFETAAITIGDKLTPAIQAVTGFITGLVNGFNSLPGPVQNAIAITAAIVAGLLLVGAAIGGVIVFIGSIISAIATIIPVVTAIVGVIGTAAAAIGGFLAFLVSWPVLIAAAAAALVAIIIANWSTIWAFLVGVWNGIKAAAVATWTALAAFFSSLWAGIKSVASSVWNSIKSFLSGLWSGIISLGAALWNGLKSALLSIGNAIRSGLIAIWNGLKAVTVAIWNALVSGAAAVFRGYIAICLGIVNAIRVGVVAAWNALKAATLAAWRALVSGVSAVFRGAVSIVMGIGNAIRSALVSAWNALKSATSAAFHALVGLIKGPLQGLNLFSIGKNLIQGLVNGIKGMAGAVWNAVKSVAGGIKDKMMSMLGIHSPSRWARDIIGKNLMLGAQIGMEDERRSTEKQAEKAATYMMPELPDISALAPTPAAAASGAAASASDRAGATTINRNPSVTLHIDNFNNNRPQDTKQLSQELAFYADQQEAY